MWFQLQSNPNIYTHNTTREVNHSFQSTQASWFLKEAFSRLANATRNNPFSQDKAFQNVLQNSIMWLRDTGVLNRLMYDIVPSLDIVPVPILKNKMPITIVQLGITMLLFLVGIALSMVMFFMEVCICKGKKKVLHTNDFELKETAAIKRISTSEVAVRDGENLSKE